MVGLLTGNKQWYEEREETGVINESDCQVISEHGLMNVKYNAHAWYWYLSCPELINLIDTSVWSIDRPIVTI